MYRIIGADGGEYGPVTADQLRQWITQGRANAESKAAVEGSTEWKPLRSFSEFASLFTTTTPPPIAPTFSKSAPVRTTNPLAVAGLIMGIVSLTFGLCCCYGFPFNLLGCVFSIVALAQIRGNPQLYDGQGIALAGLVLCALSLLLAAGMILMFGTMTTWHEMTHGIHRL
jgi:hypothetical protein